MRGEERREFEPASAIAARIGEQWPDLLRQLGIAPEYLLNRHGPCPSCGGKDRYRFDNKRGRGDFFCNGCGAGDGYTLLQRVHGWDFKTVRDRVLEAAGLAEATDLTTAILQPIRVTIAQPTARVERLRQGVRPLRGVPDAAAYLRSRGVWPFAEQTSLRAHPSVGYYEDGEHLGNFPALLAAVRDNRGELVTIHCTYLRDGAKLAGHEPRKLFGGLAGREGCAVQLQRLEGATLGLAEGIETALSAAIVHGIPVWAALNTALLRRFVPPAGVEHLVIFADRDEPGLAAAARIEEGLRSRLSVEICPPTLPHKDWNDALRAR